MKKIKVSGFVRLKRGIMVSSQRRRSRDGVQKDAVSFLCINTRGQQHLRRRKKEGVNLMAKGKYEYWLTPEGLLRLEAYARDGLTDEQIAAKMNIDTATLYRWKKKYCKICESLKRGKEIVDVQVENALLKRALGYTYNEDKYISVPMDQAEYFEKLDVYMNLYKLEHPEATDSELLMVRERFPKTKAVLTERKVKEVVPDTTAQIFWLKNRRPDIWRDKQNVELSGSLETEKSKLDDMIQQMRGGG